MSDRMSDRRIGDELRRCVVNFYPRTCSWNKNYFFNEYVYNFIVVLKS